MAVLANVDLEERMGKVFTRHLSELPAAAKDQLGAALKQSAEPALVRSHFELPGDQRKAIQDAINLTFSAKVPLRVETAGNELSGIELSAGSQKLAWTLDEYLHDLEHNVAALLAPADKAPDAPKKPDAPKPAAATAPHTDPVAA